MSRKHFRQKPIFLDDCLGGLGIDASPPKFVYRNIVLRENWNSICPPLNHNATDGRKQAEVPFVFVFPEEVAYAGLS
jgi:hypothetical protein